MKVYIAHSRLIDYQKDLYEPIREDEELRNHEIIFSHELSEDSSNSRDFRRKMDVVIAECSEPSVGLGIELGWAYDDGVPIYCISKKGSKISSSLQAVMHSFYEYDSSEEFVSVVKKILQKENTKKKQRQYCCSSYVIDFQNKKTLLMYNKKLNKWLQPGGHIEGVETPIETCVREAKEETGIDIQVIGPTLFEGAIEPIAVKRYVNKVGDMIDIQYLSIPLTHEISSPEGNEVLWIDIDDLQEKEDVDSEIKVKVKSLFEQYK